MITPDSRPIGVLTPAILATASHWCLHGNGIADTRPSSMLVLRPPEFDGDMPLLTCEGECYWNDDSNWMCYPCTLQPNGLVVPEPWPVLDGEEEIEEWSALNIASVHKGYGFVPGVKDTFHAWWDGAMRNGRYKGQIKIRSGFHPAPRKGGKWVWEADR